MHYSQALQNCVYLLNKYRWMAGDTTTPEIELDAQKDRKSAAQRKMTDAEHQHIIRLFNEGRCYKEITEETGRCYAVIIRTLKKHGIEPKPICQHLTDEQIKQIKELSNSGKSVKEISYEMNLNLKTIYRWIPAHKKHENI